jgi:DegV family protein with EDD domain
MAEISVNILKKGLCAGYERMAAWADVLDRINVFPIADDDTGRNLRISLAPLRLFTGDRSRTVARLLAAATGNSGNIAAGFFSGFLSAEPDADFSQAARIGRQRAWAAVARPRPGTMLTAFDALAEAVPKGKSDALIRALESAVRSTAETLPAMRRAGVVDAGALGVYLFFEGFLAAAAGTEGPFPPLTDTFSGLLTIAENFSADPSPRYCVDTIVATEGVDSDQKQLLADLGESVVVLSDGLDVKIHLHTDRREDVRRRLESIGRVLRWSDERIEQDRSPAARARPAGPVHVMTDAAGSLSRPAAGDLNITVLDSYLVFDDATAPETLVDPETVYRAMRRGRKVTTAQASVFERRQCYHSALSRHRRVLYLCVGSVYTGNFQTASDWKAENDPEDRFMVVDTGLASGRLAVAALAAARAAAGEHTAEAVVDAARQAIEHSGEYLFLDRLKYLAAGGRLSKTRGFFGDLLGKKPVITPTAEGAIKAGIVGDEKEQIAFALDRLDREFGRRARGLILIEHTDNRMWLEKQVLPAVAARFGAAEIRLAPLSLTAGAHMGPGTWGVAFLPDSEAGRPGRQGDGS